MTLLCFGDSNTCGYDPRDLFGGSYEAPWPALLEQKKGGKVINAGSNGRRIPGSDREREILMKLLERTSPDALLVMLGTNDILQGAEPIRCAKRMKTLLEQVRERQPQLSVLVLPPPRIELPGMEAPLEQLTAGLRAAAEQTGAAFADCRDWDIPLAFDGVHFTPEGHALFSRRLAALLSDGGWNR